ncbi:hypothetical protein L1I30_05660 [Gillisia sp. M10.2A]|uniref:Uncharacterized protein n=1 Tax=Gillisia lutea TaxID=2909668 RepID=A0ABS9EED0_9FLAO|nr:hypothetical protein [Gillisia lutea]MCF4101143.1 hypothetical protein [Gillisia lutea]
MLKVVSIFLAFLTLSSSVNFDMDDVLQMDKLVKHVQLHSEKYGDSLVVFISKHYGSLKEKHANENKEEKQDHEQLPFNHHMCAHAPTLFVVNQSISPSYTPNQVSHTVVNFFYNNSYSFLENSSVFQPPKFA